VTHVGSGFQARSRLLAGLASVLSLCACGRYADFTLPAPEGGGPGAYASRPLSGPPILTRGAPNEWDSVDVLNPSLVEFRGARWTFYSGFDGRTWRTGAAVNAFGALRKQGVVISPEAWEGKIAANGSALVAGDEILYWYQAGDPPRIALARSKDGRAFTKLPDPVVPLGPVGSFDERGVADPYVIRAGAAFYMFYLGQDRAIPTRQRLGVARSADGIRWVKLRSNPVLELGEAGAFDEMGLGEPAVWTSGRLLVDALHGPRSCGAPPHRPRAFERRCALGTRSALRAAGRSRILEQPGGVRSARGATPGRPPAPVVRRRRQAPPCGESGRTNRRGCILVRRLRNPQYGLEYLVRTRSADAKENRSPQ
jgi:hypothetical protein